MRHNAERLAIILSFVLIITMVGCNQQGKRTSANHEKPIELTFYYPVQKGNKVTNYIETLSEEFTRENPNIKINPVYTGDYQESLAAISQAKRGENKPDFFVSLAAGRYLLVERGLIEPLDKFIGEDSEYIDDFLPEFIQDSYVDNKIWGIPFQRDAQVIYYNKRAFTQAGLDPNYPPANWEELIEYSQKLVKKDSRGRVKRWGLGMGFTMEMVPWGFTAFAIQNHKTGGNIVSDDGKEVYLDTPENVEALKLLGDLRNKYKVMPDTRTSWASLPNDFINGKYAMIYSSTGNLTNIFKEANFEFGTAYLPGNKQRGTPVGGGDFYISKDTSREKKEAAWKFIKFATQPEKIAEWSVNTGCIPTRKTAFEEDLMQKYYDNLPQAFVSVNQLRFSKPEPATYGGDKIWKTLYENIMLTMDNKLSPEEALRKAQKEADKVLSNYK